MSDSLQPRGLQPPRLLRPWDPPGKSAGVGCHFLLQGIFLTQGSKPGLQYCGEILNHLSHQGRPLSWLNMTSNKVQRCPADPSLTMCPSCLHLLAMPTKSNPGLTIRHFTGDHRALLYRSNSFAQISPQVPDASSHFNGWPFLASQISL